MGWELIALFLLGLLLGIFIGFFVFFRFAYKLLQKVAGALVETEKNKKNEGYVYYWDPTGSEGSFDPH